MGTETAPLITFADLFDRARSGNSEQIRLRGEVQSRPDKLRDKRVMIEVVELQGPLHPRKTKSIPVLCDPASLESIRDNNVVEVTGRLVLDDKFTWWLNAHHVEKQAGRGRLSAAAQRTSARNHPAIAPAAAEKLALKKPAPKRLPVTLPPGRRLKVTWIGPFSHHARKDIQGQLPEESIDSDWQQVSFYDPTAIAERISAVDRDQDLIVVYRGGGSWRDWLPLNDVAVVNAVAASTVPVVAAVGHETTDVTLAWVSAGSFGTPTEVRKALRKLVFDGRTGSRYSGSWHHRYGIATDEHEFGTPATTTAEPDAALVAARARTAEAKAETAQLRAQLRTLGDELKAARSDAHTHSGAMHRITRERVSLARELALVRIEVRGIAQGLATGLGTMIAVYFVPQTITHQKWWVLGIIYAAIVLLGTSASVFFWSSVKRARKKLRRPYPEAVEVGTPTWFIRMSAVMQPRHYRRLQSNPGRF
jgi:exodeoxyribonuclease VII large subunit